MIIGGLRAFTLLDYPGQIACTVFTVGCNLRCPFCHNRSLVIGPPKERITEEEIFDFLKKRKGQLDGVTITGGEPLLHLDIGDFIAKIKALGFKVKLDTNGTFPDRLENLLKQGNVDYVAMDIKNTFEKYADTVGIPGFDTDLIKQSIEVLKRSGVTYEFRTTVVSPFHTPDDFTDIAKMTKIDEVKTEGPVGHFLQEFVDAKEDLINGSGLSAFSKEDMEKALANARQTNRWTSIRGES